MSKRKEIPLDEAEKEVELASRRIGLLHLAYAETLIDELGEEGKKVILESIKNYGLKIGAEVKKQVEEEGLDPEPDNFGKGSSRNLPKFGMNDGAEEVTVDGEERLRVHGCVMAKVWEEYGQEEIGKLYCYVDPAKYMGFNHRYKMVHTKNEPSGDDFCEFAIRKTSEQERSDFSSEMADWSYIDEKLE
ncbi:L-2-amino-thiazoline-4-carboxylic acid hydrolase [Candidatus Bipolaricaulota bacterium]|nr:L-2-amino-thiazoline-4-carboxylic acid hydrolase [Candidatus Bipolaricaulota bacterium]